jgi:hypothetical protein
MGIAMSTWKRWSWRYRISALFALMMVLQGASCPLPSDNLATFMVPGIKGPVLAQRFTDDRGRHYFMIVSYEKDGVRGYRYVFEDSDPGEYLIIDHHFYFVNSSAPAGFDRAGIPGGAGTPPAVPVQ